MTDHLATPTAPRRAGGPALRTVLLGLCVTQIVSWGVLYYAFPVLSTTITADTGWSLTTISAAFSAALVVSALVGIPVGKVLDRRGPRAVMTAGSVLAAVSVALIATAPTLALFTAGWLLAGAAMAGVLYQPAFAALTRWYGPQSLGALATVTLVAGLASTVFAPLTAALNTYLGWRSTYLLLGAGLLVVTVPLHFTVLRRSWPADNHHDHADTTTRDYNAAVVRTSEFRLLTVGLTLASLAMYSALINLIPLLLERGVSASWAAWALGLGGLGQVAGRFGYTLTAHRLTVRTSTAAVFGLSAASIAALAFLPGPLAVIIALAVLAGVARGISTLLHATAVTDRWGPRSYGQLSGILSAPVVLASALAPLAGAGLATVTGSYPMTYAGLAAMAALGAVLLTASAPNTGRGVASPSALATSPTSASDIPAPAHRPGQPKA